MTTSLRRSANYFEDIHRFEEIVRYALTYRDERDTRAVLDEMLLSAGYRLSELRPLSCGYLIRVGDINVLATREYTQREDFIGRTAMSYESEWRIDINTSMAHWVAYNRDANVPNYRETVTLLRNLCLTVTRILWESVDDTTKRFMMLDLSPSARIAENPEPEFIELEMI